MIQMTIKSADSQESQKIKEDKNWSTKCLLYVELGKTRIQKDEKHAKWVVGRLNIWVPEIREKEKVLVSISEGQLATIKVRNNACIVLEGEKGLQSSCQKF